MVRALRKRPRPDTLANEKRRIGNNAGRLVYLGLLIVFGLGVFDYLVGDFLFLRADGLVLRDRTVIAATYVARVEAVDVREGQKIKAGEVLLKVQSSEMLERLADLSSRRAQLAARGVDFEIRAATVVQLLPLAQKREQETGKTVSKFDTLARTGLVTATGYDDALRASFDARQERVRLSTQGQALRQELAALQAARQDAEIAFANLRQHYAEGVVRAPVGGAIGATIPAVGAVYRPGESILSIHSGEAYVLAYLPRRYLFPIRVGQKVRIADGRHGATGVIAEILPVTDALPTEFQNTFKPRDRSQLAKIRIPNDVPFPVHQKVEITRN